MKMSLVSNFSIRRLAAIFISALLIALAFCLADAEGIVRRLAGFPPWAVASMLLLLLANLSVVSLRLWRVLAHFGIMLSWNIALRASIAGAVAGLFMIPLFGQVIGRQAVLQSYGVSPVVNASLAAYERTLLALLSGTLGVLGGFYLLGQSAVADFADHIALPEIVIASCGAGGLSLWLGLSRFEKKLFNRLASKANLVRMVSIAGLTLVSQLLMLGCFVVGILAVNKGVPVASLYAASAIISFAASMPIGVGGWGVREVAAVYVLGNLGIPAADALAMSIMAGLCATLITLGVVPFCLRRLPRA